MSYLMNHLKKRIAISITSNEKIFQRLMYRQNIQSNGIHYITHWTYEFVRLCNRPYHPS